MNIFYPVFPLKHLPVMLRIAVLGGLLAGGYGAIHDQISYTISAEYFTKLKFYQFGYANFGWPQRVFASEVGFLASWWVGFAGGWILARLGLAELPAATRQKSIATAFSIVFGTAVVCALVGTALGAIVARGNLSAWNHWQHDLGLQNLQSFVVVAYLHAASYAGALLGIICAGVYVRRVLAKFRTAANSGIQPAV